MRKLIILLVVLAFAAVPAFAFDGWDDSKPGSSIDGTCECTVTLTIDQWAQLLCQECAIQFSPSNVSGYVTDCLYDPAKGDWYDTQLDGWYQAIDDGCDNKASIDPWAGAAYKSGGTDLNPTGFYYESADCCHHYVRTNTDLTAQASTSDLTGSVRGTIPHWFTICFAPFVNAGAEVADNLAIPPKTDKGGYGTVSAAGALNTGPDPVAHQTFLYKLTAPAWGTVTFHSRILRKGMSDVAGTYSGTITVSYQ